MKVLILGGGGVVGQKLARALAARGTLRGQAIDELVLADLAAPPVFDAAMPVTGIRCDITDPAALAAAIGPDTGAIFLLAAVVSAHAEAELDAGLDTNMTGTLNVLQRCRWLDSCPVVVFTSSIAVFGGAVPDPVTDDSFLNPQTSYGTQKAIGELLLNDFSRRGLVDGRGFRLPTISIRPGRPNRAASSFMSSIFREPLNGQPAACPVGRDFPHYYLSPRRCVENLIRGAELAAGDLGPNRCMTMPGRTWRIGEMIQAMTDIAGPGPAALIRWEPEPETQRIVSGWRFDIRADRALRLGLTADDSFADNIRHYLADDLPAAPG